MPRDLRTSRALLRASAVAAAMAAALAWMLLRGGSIFLGGISLQGTHREGKEGTHTGGCARRGAR